MLSSKANSKLLRNACKVFFRRKQHIKAVDKAITPFVVHSHKLFAEEDIKKYHARFPELIQSLCDEYAEFKTPMDRFATNMSKLLPNRMIIDGLKVIECFNSIPCPKSEEQIRNAEILAWCTEIQIHTYQITDDLNEQNRIRWGNPSYFTWEGVGMHAVNDAVLFENFSYFLVKKYFRNKPWYQDCMDLLHETCLETAIGQSLEPCLYHKGELQLQHWTPENYKKYCIYQGGFPGIRMPLMMAHFATDTYDPDLPKKAKNIIEELGMYITIQNDMVDYITKDKTEKGGISDIGRGGFNWLIIQALTRGTRGQKDILKQHYAVNNPESIQKVSEVYEDLKMVDLYNEWKKNSHDYLHAETEKAPISNAYKTSILRMIEILYTRVK